MSSGPCQKPAAANAWRSARPVETRLALRNHAQGHDAALVFIRPREHQLRAARRGSPSNTRTRKLHRPGRCTARRARAGSPASMSSRSRSRARRRRRLRCDTRDAAGSGAAPAFSDVRISMTGSVIGHRHARLARDVDLGQRRRRSAMRGASWWRRRVARRRAIGRLAARSATIRIPRRRRRTARRRPGE